MPYLNYNGIKVYYRRLGVKTDLPPLILIHGAFANHLAWYSQIKFFSKLTEILVFDLPGHGKSDNPSIEYTPQFFGKIVKRLIEEENIKSPILAGHSLGGVIAQTAALMYPELIEKLVLLCTGVILSYGIKIWVPTPVKSVLGKIFSLFSWNLFCTLLSKLTAKHEIPGLEGVRLEARMAASCSGRAFLNIIGNLLDYDISDKVKSIKMPILFVTGTKDLFHNQAKFYKRFPNAVVKIVEGGKHVLQLLNEEPNQWMLEFIKS